MRYVMAEGALIFVINSGMALQCIPGTELVLTLTSGVTSVITNDRSLRLVKAPQELHAFSPRLLRASLLNFQILVGSCELRFELVRLGISEHLPPRSLGFVVAILLDKKVGIGVDGQRFFWIAGHAIPGLSAEN